jgi:23S rRNA (cytidine1920-2'-O)/16S rRNA (cytidine1409-2'-O)-methyltransferase
MQGQDEKGGFVGRGGLKLEAALAKLGGAERIRGAVALDVGASTGGFTEVLLQHGARQVTALEVGHSQLHERLRADPRVVNLEKTNFKTVSLKVAPGPFDYFVVDVSFVAARTMLRPLAFRLRPGAEGVILVKPQFELPDEMVRDGQVKSERLRQWALHRVVKKGAELGFEMLGSAESPVQLESGTIEVLTRWRFKGPTGKLTGQPEPVAQRAPARPQPAQGKPGPAAPRTSPPPEHRSHGKPGPAASQPKSPPRPQPKPQQGKPEPKKSGRALPFEVPPMPPRPPRKKK